MVSVTPNVRVQPAGVPFQLAAHHVRSRDQSCHVMFVEPSGSLRSKAMNSNPPSITHHRMMSCQFPHALPPTRLLVYPAPTPNPRPTSAWFSLHIHLHFHYSSIHHLPFLHFASSHLFSSAHLLSPASGMTTGIARTYVLVAQAAKPSG